MSPIEAHIRLLALLPVRTVSARPTVVLRAKGRANAKETIELHKRIVELTAKGKSRLEIAKELGVSPSTVGRHWNGKIQLLKKKK